MEKVTAGKDALGKFAPEFAHLNDEVLFGEIWAREDKLSLRDRSLITVTTLIASGITDSSLAYHLKKARENGVTASEMAEAITHIAFYAGWPKAWAAFRLAKDIFAEGDLPRGGMFGLGQPNTAYAKYFIGKSYLKPLTDGTKTVFMANVTFEPSCRNNWHIHKAESGGGQILLCTEGRGGIASGVRLPVRLNRATLLPFLPGLSTGTAPQRIVGFPT